MARLRPLIKTGLIHFGFLRLATSFFYTGLITLTLPMILVEFVGDRLKGVYLGTVIGGSSLFTVICLFVLGYHSDRFHWGNRRWRFPAYILISAVFPLFVVFFNSGYRWTIAAIVCLFCIRSLCDASHMAILAEFIPYKDKSAASSSLALQHFIGTGLGALLFGFLPLQIMISDDISVRPLAGLAILVIIIAQGGYLFSTHIKKEIIQLVPKTELKGGVPIGRDFVLFLLARMFFLSGIFIISTFLVYTVKDLMAPADPKQTAALLYGGALVGGLVSTLPVKYLIEKLGEKSTLLLAGSILAGISAVFLLLGGEHPVLSMGCMLVYGAGFTTVMTAGIALSAKLIPNRSRAGRLMAMLTASTFGSQAIAALTGAGLLDPLNRLGENYGYYGLLAAIEVFLFLGAVCLVHLNQPE